MTVNICKLLGAAAQQLAVLLQGLVDFNVVQDHAQYTQ